MDERFHGLICFEDQGGKIMSQVEKPWALRAQMRHHEPIVCYGIDQQGGKSNCGYAEDVMMTLCSDSHGTPHAVCYGLSKSCVEGGNDSNGGMSIGENIQPTITTNGTVGAVCYSGDQITSKTNRSNPMPGDPCHTLSTDSRNYVVIKNESIPTDNRSAVREQPVMEDKAMEWYCAGNGQLHQMSMGGVMNTLDTMHDQQAVVGKTNRKYIIRRLTPLECCRLQGFPDWWVDGADGSDSAKYKMWGNGIALPCAADVLGRLAKELGKGGDEDESD